MFSYLSRHWFVRRASAVMRAAAVSLAAMVTLASCSSGGSEQTPSASVSGAPIIDDFGDTLRLRGPAQRVVSLNPVISEAMFALRAESRLVGRSRWDAAPAEIVRVPSVGDGIQPNVEAVLAARPDLVVLYAADANRAAAAAFRRAGVQTLTLRTDRIEDFARNLRALGVALGDSVAARTVADSVRASLAAVPPLAGAKPVSVFWHAWDSPVITIGAGSYLHELITRIGALNVFGDLAAPSPQVTLESVAKRDPDYVLAGPQTAPKLRADPRWRTVEAVRAGRVLVFDTTLIGRPGVRMGEAARSLRALIDSAERARP